MTVTSTTQGWEYQVARNATSQEAGLRGCYEMRRVCGLVSAALFGARPLSLDFLHIQLTKCNVLKLTKQRTWETLQQRNVANCTRTMCFAAQSFRYSTTCTIACKYTNWVGSPSSYTSVFVILIFLCHPF